MKLTKLKKVLLSLLLLNTLVACKYQVDFEQLDSDGNVITNNVEIIDQPSSIIDHQYNSNSGELALTIETTSYVGELKGDLEMSVCTESYPATCHAKLEVYSQRIKTDLDFGLPSVMVRAQLNLDLSNLDGVSKLIIADDAGETITIDLLAQTADRLHRQLYIESIVVNAERGVFTVNAKHQICDGPGELELDYLHYAQVEPQPYPAADRVAMSIEPQPIRPILPPERTAALLLRVKGGQPELACKFVAGHYLKVAKTFSFRDAGVTYGQSLKIIDATKKLNRIRYIKDVTNRLLEVASVEVNVEQSTLSITTPYYEDGLVEMGPCAVADGFTNGVISQRCDAKFVSTSLYDVQQEPANDQLIGRLPALKTTTVSLSEVGLGQNNSILILNFQGGRAEISINNYGKAAVKIERMLDAITTH